MALLFVFLDGVGLAPASDDNPLADAPMPTLRTLLGGPLTSEQIQRQPRLLLSAIDATLGVDGLPQSGTGHTALLAGVNAAALHGRHQPHTPPVALRPMLERDNIFVSVAASGGSPAFANVFGDGYWEAVAQRRIRLPASVIAARGGGVRFRDQHDMASGAAISWDITGEAMLARGRDVAMVPPETAGVNLARLGQAHQFVFFECFLLDLAAHGRWGGDAPRAALHAALARIDGLVAGALHAMRPQDTLLITSDHGNAESLSAPSHTRAPVPLLAVGAGSERFAAVADIAGIAAAVVAVAAT